MAKLKYELTDDGKGYAVVGVEQENEYDTDIVIPQKHRLKPVTSIIRSAFFNCKSLTSITIPGSVIYIGSYMAFDGCDSLTSITVDEKNKVYKSIDGNIYTKDGTTMIKYAVGKRYAEFVIPEGVTAIGEYAFSGCKELRRITIPCSVTSIDNYAFYGCDKLSNITVAEDFETGKLVGIGESKYTSIDGVLYSDGGKTLAKCPSYKMETEFVIPEGVTAIGEYAFSGCKELRFITIPDSVKSIGNFAFYGCDTNFTVDENNTVYKSIGGNLYTKDGTTLIRYSISKLWEQYAISKQLAIEFTIPDGVTSIGDLAFSSCYSLTSVTIPDSVTSIGNSAFSGCKGLRRITIPNSVTSIGNFAFDSCPDLTIYCEAAKKPAGFDMYWSNNKVVWGYKGK